MKRYVGVLAPATLTPLTTAMFKDVVELVDDMAMVQACLVVQQRFGPWPDDYTWRGMPVVDVPDRTIRRVVAALDAIGAEEVGIVVPDVPDLPALLLGKLHSALTTAEVAVCPAEDGRLVALATRVPVAEWAPNLTLDEMDALGQLYAAAPRRDLHVGAGWHRVSDDDDARRLDPGLEGWEHTRAVLGL